MKIRIAQQADLAQIVEIYNQAVASRAATADLDPIEPGDRVQWFEEHAPEKYPVYVAEVDDKVVGWCSLSPYRRGRMALRYTAEISYYIHEDHRRTGIGSALVKHTIARCTEVLSSVPSLFTSNPLISA
jgi:L-amino acid N-acyltransferase YncA